jgi:hypothetical protein
LNFSPFTTAVIQSCSCVATVPYLFSTNCSKFESHQPACLNWSILSIFCVSFGVSVVVTVQVGVSCLVTFVVSSACLKSSFVQAVISGLTHSQTVIQACAILAVSSGVTVV